MMYCLYRLGEFIAVYFPRWASYSMATFLGGIYFYIAVKDRRRLYKNISIVLGRNAPREELRILARGTFINFAKYLVDFFRVKKIDKKYIDDFIKVDNIEAINKALAKGKGVIVVSSHFGNWELGGVVFGLLGYKINAIVLSHKDKRINDFFVNKRERFYSNIISLGEGIKKCISVLKQNHLLAILGDRDLSNAGQPVEFFGKPASLPRGPAVLAARTGAQIAVAFMIREKNDTYRLALEAPDIPESTGDYQKDILNSTRSYVKIMEKYIRQYPDQWYLFNNIWE